MGSLLNNPPAMEFDEDGFLTDPSRWSKEVAEQIASQDGLGGLSDEHWAIIRELREHYLEHGALLPPSRACRVEKLDAQCVANLFRDMREAWRVAGLPNPGEEAKSYM